MLMKWMVVVAVIGVGFLLMRVWAQPSAGEQVGVPEKLAQGARVLDVRTAREFEAGHYPGATHIPVQDLENRVTELGATNQAFVVYCGSGYRATQAQRILHAAGFPDVTNAGGLKDMPK
ncbi:MAG: rhodanese-like domain-containing protein [Verrucomicrobia bacterium]|nr:rhodanese-like domain-containing protein [Verrucomicrobiota bacterium]